MRLTICALALAAMTAGPALAADPAVAQKIAPPEPQKVARTVFVCDDSAKTKRAFEREYGKMEFVTAEAAAAKGESWSAPKCVTAAEARRLKQLAAR